MYKAPLTAISYGFQANVLWEYDAQWTTFSHLNTSAICSLKLEDLDSNARDIIQDVFKHNSMLGSADHARTIMGNEVVVVSQ